ISGTPFYEVVATVKGSLGTDGTLASPDKKNKPGADEPIRTTGSVGASINASVSLSYAHRLDADEVRAYVDAADAADAGRAPASAPPEIGMLARFRAAADMAGSEAAMWSRTAADMPVGDHVDLVTTIGGDARFGGAKGTAKIADGAEGSVSASRSR